MATDPNSPAAETPVTSRVEVLTEETVVTRIRGHYERLTTMAGTTDLAEIVDDGLSYDLGRRAAADFHELQDLGFLAGLDSLPCCAGDDPDRIATWISGVEQIVTTGRLPQDV